MFAQSGQIYDGMYLWPMVNLKGQCLWDCLLPGKVELKRKIVLGIIEVSQL